MSAQLCHRQMLGTKQRGCGGRNSIYDLKIYEFKLFVQQRDKITMKQPLVDSNYQLYTIVTDHRLEREYRLICIALNKSRTLYNFLVKTLNDVEVN